MLYTLSFLESVNVDPHAKVGVIVGVGVGVVVGVGVGANCAVPV